MADESATAGATPFVRPIETDRKLQRVYRYRSVQALGYTVVALGACYGLSLVAVVAAFLLALTPVDSQDARTGLAVASVLRLVLLLSTYVAAGFWIYNAACNARAFGAKNLQVSPGWSIGWYCVPIMNLYKPFQAMDEIWDASVSPAAWQAQRTPALLRWWWGAWLATNIIGGAVSTSDNTVLQTGAIALEGVAVALFLTIVWRVTRMQTTRTNDVAEVFA